MTYPDETFQLEEIAPSAWQRHLVLANGNSTFPYNNQISSERRRTSQETAANCYESEVRFRLIEIYDIILTPFFHRA